MTKFTKGKSGNEAGRPKGKQNSVTIELKTWIAALIDNNRDQLETDLKQLEPKDRWQIIEKLMQYTIPKMQSVDAKLELERLSDQQLSELTQSLLNEIRDGEVN